MQPTIVLGPLHISTYALLYGVAILTAGMLAFHRLLRTGAPPGQITVGLSATVAAGLLGAVLGMAVVRWIWDLSPALAPLHVVRGGSTILGSIAFGTITGVWYCRAHGLSTLAMFDTGIVAMPLGQAIGRLGCLGAGCCYGKPTTSWLGMNLPGAGGEWALRYPTQLLSSAADLAIFAALLAVSRLPAAPSDGASPGRAPGTVTLLYFGLYASKRLAIEFLRDDNEVVLWVLTWPQVISLAILGLVALLVLHRLFLRWRS